ncbi:ABC transporter ATP-binding protein [bacterium]|nr:ABC transporter ATP-binding protein [bacterium]
MTPVLSLKNYQAFFHTRRGVIKAVNGISYDVFPGQTLAVVGESGSGKSVSQLSYLGLLTGSPLQIMGGQVLFHGQDLVKMDEPQLRAIRGDKIAMIFQEPMTSLNPYLKIGTQLIEPLVIHRKKTKREAWKLGIEALERVGISRASTSMEAYPHEFSGGMRQRVMIAMALTTDPQVLIADEPTTALDVTVQAQILELLKSIQKEKKMAMILITHDLGVVANSADQVVVMYAGKIFEKGSVDDIFYRSRHPYTQALLRSTPRIDRSDGPLPAIAGNTPDLLMLKEGCPFAERCTFKETACEERFPEANVLGPQHIRFCHSEKVGA